MPGEGQRGGLAVFRHKDYRNYFSSRVLWGMGLQIQTVAIAWIVYDLTSDALALGLIGLATFIPTVPLTLETGPRLFSSWPGRDFNASSNPSKPMFFSAFQTPEAALRHGK